MLAFGLVARLRLESAKLNNPLKMSQPEQQWYFISVVNQERYGPYSAEQLEGFVKSGSITRETLIWTEALQDQWIPAANVEGLFPPEGDTPAAPAAPTTRPQLLTGTPVGSPRPLVQAAPLRAHPLQAQPLQAQPAQSVQPVQPVQPVQRVAPGMIPSSMPGIARPAATAVGGAQTSIKGLSSESSEKKILPAFLLCTFLGILGIHRFYVGKTGSGIAQILTLGGIGFWSFVDWIMLLCKSFKDSKGKSLREWT